MLAALFIAVAALAMPLPVLGGDADEGKTTRVTMDSIFDAMSVLLPLSLDEAQFEHAANRKEVERLFEHLVRSAEQLEAHDRDRGEGFRNLTRSLAYDVHFAKEHYRAQRYAESRYLLQVLTDTCVACHSRLPGRQEFPFADRLLARVELDALSSRQRARLLVALRQFEDALDAYEQIFADREIPAGQLDLGGHLVEYLIVAIRVVGDLERPVPVLRRLAKRLDTSDYLRARIDGWIRSLEDLKSRGDLPSDLQTARDLLRRGRDANDFPSDRGGLVYDVAASGLLHRFVESSLPASPARAEAYYLLGIAESRSRASYWLSETELYLEAAIRSAPDAPFARKAYTVLEEFIVLGYTGSAGENVPPEMREKLDELRRLVYPPGPSAEKKERSDPKD